MATTINKQRLLTHLFTATRKTVDADPEAEPRPVLHEFIYALCREDATREEADRAFQNLCERFFDWNEVRVSSLRELEEAFAGLSNAAGRAERLSAFLREVFDTEFSFDLDKQLLKKGLKLAAKQLAGYQAANEYIGAWVMQRSLGRPRHPAGRADAPLRPPFRLARRRGRRRRRRPREPGASGAEGEGAALHGTGQLFGRQILLGRAAALFGLPPVVGMPLRPGNRPRTQGKRQRPSPETTLRMAWRARGVHPSLAKPPHNFSYPPTPHHL